MTTPGPWAVLPLKTKTLIVSAHNLHVAALENASPVDAALMASAPALLEALQGLADAVERFTNATPQDWPELTAARAAIANAMGGQP